jgi:DnaJ-class molecular chaperone
MNIRVHGKNTQKEKIKMLNARIKKLACVVNDFEDVVNRFSFMNNFDDEYSKHYKLLGIHPDSTNQQVKIAFRKLVLEYHPDKSKKNTTKELKKTINAYEYIKSHHRQY